MGEGINESRVLRISPEGKRPLEKLTAYWRIIIKFILT
jgi:hypothetical protein